MKMADINTTRVISTDSGFNISTILSNLPLSNVTTTFNLASKSALTNLSVSETSDLNATIENSIANVSPLTIGTENTSQEQRQQNLDIFVDKVVNDWIVNKRNSPVLNNPNNNSTSKLLGIPVPSTSAIDTLTGQGIAVPYDPNVRFSQLNAQEQIRQPSLAERARLLNPRPKSIGLKANDSNLIDTITGADLSVFFLTEIPNINDVATGVPKHLWQKEIMLIEIDSVLSATYSIMREVFPVRSVGTTKPKGFARGPVTISGSLAFTIFTEDVLVRLRTQIQESIMDVQKKASAVISEYNKMSTAASADTKELENLTATFKLYNTVLNTGGIFMLNQLLPFHILMMGTTERGIFSKMMIKNIRVIDENQMQGVQQPNIVNRISFVAEDIFPLMSGNLANMMDYSATATTDQNNISTNKHAVYTGSQVMKDISAMTAGDYRLENR
jgi:hypothetical protein